MKKFAAIFIAVLLPAFILKAEVLSVDPEATPKPIRITVEGVADAKPTSLTTIKDVFFKNELFKPNTANSVASIKKLADNNAMEGEIIDAIITKLSDIEEEMKTQRLVNTGLFAGLMALIVLAIVMALRKRK